MTRPHDGFHPPGPRGRILHLVHEASGFLRPSGLSLCLHPDRGPRFARMRSIHTRALRLPTAAGGRLEAVGLRWSFGERGVADVLLVAN